MPDPGCRRRFAERGVQRLRVFRNGGGHAELFPAAEQVAVLPRPAHAETRIRRILQAAAHGTRRRIAHGKAYRGSPVARHPDRHVRASRLLPGSPRRRVRRRSRGRCIGRIPQRQLRKTGLGKRSVRPPRRLRLFGGKAGGFHINGAEQAGFLQRGPVFLQQVVVPVLPFNPRAQLVEIILVNRRSAGRVGVVGRPDVLFLDQHRPHAQERTGFDEHVRFKGMRGTIDDVPALPCSASG